MKKSSFRAQHMKRKVCDESLGQHMSMAGLRSEPTWSYLVGVVFVHQPAPLNAHVLVALSLSTHDQSGIHVHVVARQIQADQALEDHRVGGFPGR